MRAIHAIMFLFLSVTALSAGCQAPAEEPSPLEGVKLSDLRPLDAPRRGLVLPSGVYLKAVTFSIPAAGYERAVRLTLAALDSGPGILSSEADFHANGFVAAEGRLSQMNVISEVLKQAQATLLASNYYTVYDDKGDDIEMTGVQQVTPISYWNKGISQSLALKPGHLAIRLRVKRFTSRASVFRVTVQPVWKPHQNATLIERVSGRSREIIFAAAGINTNMQAGDMVVIAPSPAAHEGTTLADTMMASRDGDFTKMTIVMCTGISQ
jgi:hypothetical protein